MGAKKALLIGDPRQLPSTVFSPAALDLGSGVSTMERVFDSCEHVMLTEQYRMHPELRQWPSEKFYSGLLSDHESVLTRPLASSPAPTLLPNARVRVLVVCSGEGPERVGTSWKCDAEKEVAIQLVADMKALGSIGVIAFYAAQQESLEQVKQKTFKCLFFAFVLCVYVDFCFFFIVFLFLTFLFSQRA